MNSDVGFKLSEKFKHKSKEVTKKTLVGKMVQKMKSHPLWDLFKSAVASPKLFSNLCPLHSTRSIYIFLDSMKRGEERK